MTAPVPTFGPAAGQGSPIRGFAPRPLPLHLSMACSMAWHDASAASPGSTPTGNGNAETVQSDADAILRALDRIMRMLAGVDAYRRHPWRREPLRKPVIWSEGTSRLLDCAPDADGQPVLFLPSLVNRSWILDLLPSRSLMQWLARRGFRPLLLDWGVPGEAEREFGIGDYVMRRLLPALSATARDRPIDLAGYCMGGHFALAAATLAPERCRRIALIATPWDFSAATGMGAVLRQVAVGIGADRLRQMLRLATFGAGGLPVDFLQSIFALLDPGLALAKFSRFAELPPDSEDARLFVAAEDWLNDGVPLAPKVAEELLVDWCLANATGEGRWKPNGRAVTPPRIPHPALVIGAEGDRIAPAESVRPLALGLQQAEWRQIRCGHIGMMAGSKAQALLWEPLADWLRRT